MPSFFLLMTPPQLPSGLHDPPTSFTGTAPILPLPLRLIVFRSSRIESVCVFIGDLLPRTWTALVLFLESLQFIRTSRPPRFMNWCPLFLFLLALERMATQATTSPATMTCSDPPKLWSTVSLVSPPPFFWISQGRHPLTPGLTAPLI